MKTADIRESFLSFFEAKGATRVPSASLVPEDPSLLLTVAGMVPFKPVFLGVKSVPYVRAVSAQKCVRTNDIDIIGTTGRHLSFFEMLGNFSFGDYFKREAITWAWEYSTDVLNLDPVRLWASVFTDDDEAAELWVACTGIPAERVVRLGEEDNFWAAGPTGPCGPCSELYYDRGEEWGCGEDCQVGCDCDRFVEYWNLVFMQFDRAEDGTMTPLEKQSIDTGLGLERMAAILQDVRSNYDIDLMQDIMALAAAISGRTYGADEQDDIALRIITDHARAVAFLIADGVLPSNEGRGYVLRRLLRRAVRYGRLLDIERPFMIEMVDKVIDIMGDAYPELRQHRDLIAGIVGAEEERFAATLRTGLGYLDRALAELGKNKELPGTIAFELHDTYGFPIDLTVEIAAEHNVTVDLAGFDAAMVEQKERARAGTKDASWDMAESTTDTSVDDACPYRARNHTATHLLHQVLRDELGSHATQAGSEVTPEKLRFDFVHFEALTTEQLRRIELLVNEKIAENIAVETDTMSLEAAREKGAMALFGEKYEEVVRVVCVGTLDDAFSKELCGGTHVGHTSEIGSFRIVKESSVGASLRRIEAVTGLEAYRWSVEREDKLAARTDELVAEIKDMKSRLKQVKSSPSGFVEKIIEGDMFEVDGYRVAVPHIKRVREVEELKVFWDNLRAKGLDAVVLITKHPDEEKTIYLAAGTDKAVAAGFDAAALVRDINDTLGGRGGGKPTMAQGGADDTAHIDAAIAHVRKTLGA
ncbi:MAG: alanine--tRNA ligase [Coriobacteriia bacterium]|nr:alanine--tRNA ligase [Coriobacteriia bacterium]